MGPSRSRIELCGELVVELDGRRVEDSLPGRQGRLLFAFLVLNRDRSVSRDELTDAIWGEGAPTDADAALRTRLSKLRRALGPDVIEGRAALTLVLPPDAAIDVERARELIDGAEQDLAKGALHDALAAAQAAGEIARRRFLPGLEAPWVEDVRRELEEVRLRALETIADAGVRLGGSELGSAERAARDLVEAAPFREAGYRSLMRAHAARGNVAEALQVYELLRCLLRDELGTTPSASVKDLHAQLLTDGMPDVSTASAAVEAPPAVPRGLANGHVNLRRRRGLAMAGLALVAAVVVSALTVLRSGSARVTPVPPDSVAAVDPASGRVVAVVPVGVAPGGIVSAAGSLWVLNRDDHTVSRVDPAARRVTRTIPLAGEPTGIAATGRAVWVIGQEGKVQRIDPSFDRVVATVDLGGPFAAPGSSLASIAADQGVVWAAGTAISPAASKTLGLRIDPSTNSVTARVDLTGRPSGIAVGPGSAWVAAPSENTVFRIASDNATTAAIRVGLDPTTIAVGGGSVWVADSNGDTVARIDPMTNSVVATVPVGRDPNGFAITPGAVFVVNGRSGSISRISPRRNAVTSTIAVGNSPTGIAWAAGLLWVTVGSATAVEPPARGQTLRVLVGVPFSSPDPALSSSVPEQLEVDYATCAKLLNYPDRPGPQGSVLIPEVARGPPAVSAGGRRYTFVIRKGFRFSPPSTQAVTAQTFKYTIERTLDPRVHAYADAFMGDIVGASAYMAGRAKHISGVSVRGNALTIELTRPAGSLPARLAVPWFCAVPIGTPADPSGIGAIPTAGPYYVASYTANQRLVLQRNPNYHGPRPRHWQAIDYDLKVPPPSIPARIEAGHADYAVYLPVGSAGPLLRQYGPGSAAARSGRQRIFADPTFTLDYYALNTSRPLFASAAMRRAVNYAIDRRALAQLPSAGAAAGGILPSDRYVPVNMPGAPARAVYPLRGDAARARRLVGPRRRSAVLFSCDEPACHMQVQELKTELARANIDLKVRYFARFPLQAKTATRGEGFDIAQRGWLADYADPSTFLNTLLDGRTIRPEGNTDVAYFHDPAYERRLDAAARLPGPARYRAYARLGEDLERKAAPWAAVGTLLSYDFFSARIGCQVFHPVYYVDLGALCVRH